MPTASQRPNTKKPLILLVLLFLLASSMIAGVTIGTVTIHSWDIFVDSLFGRSPSTWQPWEELILWRVRLPRVLIGVLVGGGLSLAGAVMQGVFRNPMADPGIIGISGGASLGAVVAIATGLASRWMLALPVCSFVVAVGCAFLVYTVSAARGKSSIITLLLAGIAIGGIASSLTSFVLTLSLDRWFVGQEIIRWLMGGFDGKTWTDVALAAPLVLGCSGFLLLFSRDLNVMASGEEVAQSLGVDVPMSRALVLTLATAVTAAAVSVSGTLVFVGLIVPHILRLIVGAEHRMLMISSFLGGAILLVFADLLARTILPAQEIRLGVLISLLGGPFFLYLLIAHKVRVEGV
ncbi:MAG: FecCD family ABC transporter permease [Gemmataceae bacterium]